MWQVAEYQIFGMEYPPEYYSLLLNEKSVQTDPPPHQFPIRVTFDITAEEVERIAAQLR